MRSQCFLASKTVQQPFEHRLGICTTKCTNSCMGEPHSSYSTYFALLAQCPIRPLPCPSPWRCSQRTRIRGITPHCKYISHYIEDFSTDSESLDSVASRESSLSHRLCKQPWKVTDCTGREATKKQKLTKSRLPVRTLNAAQHERPHPIPSRG